MREGQTVRRWRERSAKHRLDGLDDEPRCFVHSRLDGSCRPPVLTAIFYRAAQRKSPNACSSSRTDLAAVEALALATGRELLHDKPYGRSRVWLWHGEDPADELQRRIMAACLYLRNGWD